MRGLFRVLELLKESTSCDYTSYYADVKTEIYKLFNKYKRKFDAAMSQKDTQPASHTGKRKQAWGRIFGGPRSGVVGPFPASAPTLSTSSSIMCELSVYVDSDNVTTYEDDFDLLLWWHDHKLTYLFTSKFGKKNYRNSKLPRLCHQGIDCIKMILADSNAALELALFR